MTPAKIATPAADPSKSSQGAGLLPLIVDRSKSGRVAA